MAGDEALSGGRLIAGLGLRPGTDAAEILACLDEALAIAGFPNEATPRFATLAGRADESGLREAAASRSAEIVAIPDEALRGFEAACATRSTRIASLYGVGSVAEAAAMAAAGPGGTLIQPRIATGRVTCALARAAA